MVLLLPLPVCAQIRGRAPVQPSYGWWISGGASAAVMGTVTDGASQSKWNFGSDPVWQGRGTLEKAIDEFTSIGAVVAYGKANAQLSSIATGTNTHLPSACQATCDATLQLWTGMLQFRSGGGNGFHTLFEASAGATVFRDFRMAMAATTPATPAVPIAGIRRTIDPSGSIGLGFGYALSSGFVVALVQDAGIGFHSKTDLPSGTGRTWRMRNTRASIRIRF